MGRATRKKMDVRAVKNQILDFLEQHHGQGFKAKELAKTLGIPQANYVRFRNLLKEMAEEGEIRKGRHARYSKTAPSAEVVGRLHVKTQGYGFVLADDGTEVFVSQRNMGTAFHQDVVRVRLFASRRGDSPEGKIVEVVERARTNIVGTYRRGKRFGFVVPDEVKIQWDILVADVDSMGAVSGQKVVVQITEWEHEQANPIGKVVRVLGFPDEPGVDVESVAYSFDLPLEFPKNVEKEAERLPEAIPAAELDRRLDLRDLEMFTIDPAEAKDFDDAVSLEELENGNLRLGVHIADVSFYVKDGSAVDREARRRGTSVYLVDRVIPMLPERLSNQLCSLRPEEDRLAYSVLMEVTPRGDLVDYEIRESVIRSDRRYTYEEVQDILEGKAEDEHADTLRKMLALSRALIAKRHRRGGIDFDTAEVEIELDAEGTPVAIHRKKRLDSHRLIEEFMLLANETVARHVGVNLAKKAGKEFPFVYRIHEKPSDEKMAVFLQLLRAFGVDAAPPQQLRPRYFQRLVDQLEDEDLSVIVQDAMIRAMMKARYSTENVGHFGLAYRYYTHFTSPIRRYPDLMVHRLLKRYARHQRPGSVSGLEETCELATRREIVAMEAERESVKLKQVEFMEQHVGEVFDGVIARVVPFGMFVELPQFLVDGLVHVTEMGDDYFAFDEERFALVGERSGQVFRLGDRVKVEVIRADKNQRLIDFKLVETNGKKGAGSKASRRGRRSRSRRRAG